MRKAEYYFVKQLQMRDKEAPDDDAATRIVPMLREYTVFNVDQCHGLPDLARSSGAILTIPLL